MENSNMIKLFENAYSKDTNENDFETVQIENININDRDKTNQGLGHSLNGARFLSNHLYHRHWSECFFTKACINKEDIISFTLPVANLGTNGRKVEVDFLIFDEVSCQWGILEVQGASHLNELAVDRDDRLKRFEESDVFIKYYYLPNNLTQHTQTENLDWANKCLDDFLMRLRKKKKFPIISWEDYSK